MKQSELSEFFQSLAGDEFRLALIVAAAVVVLSIIVIVYLLLRKSEKRGSVAEDGAADVPEVPANAKSSEPSPKASANTMRMAVPKASVAIPPRLAIPEDSVLRRHYMSHVRYMIETITFPCPTDCMLRRHYEHLISSRLEDCLSDEAQMNRLISSYEEHRRNGGS
ncbi:hypothetical protein sS8_5523 [Methylocaldum marinum]|uniref:Uncharacterized protein n=1 Tax=Methylocaldum marinum TaxID=1432792 RepID=A0A250L0M3_9GAMM|nr:hypothetical protein [Methylocaldum marinum]BBA37440.1 hypothetical protein sS8_5523 [Methylocaldum marinum]